MDGDCCCQHYEEGSESPMLSNKNSTVKQCQPKGCDCYNLYPQRNGFMFHEVGDIWTKLRMIHQPIIQSPVATQEQRSRQKKQWSGRKNGKECPKDSKSQRQQSEYSQYYVQHLSQKKWCAPHHFIKFKVKSRIP